MLDVSVLYCIVVVWTETVSLSCGTGGIIAVWLSQLCQKTRSNQDKSYVIADSIRCAKSSRINYQSSELEVMRKSHSTI